MTALWGRVAYLLQEFFVALWGGLSAVFEGIGLFVESLSLGSNEILAANAIGATFALLALQIQADYAFKFDVREARGKEERASKSVARIRRLANILLWSGVAYIFSTILIFYLSAAVGSAVETGLRLPSILTLAALGVSFVALLSYMLGERISSWFG